MKNYFIFILSIVLLVNTSCKEPKDKGTVVLAVTSDYEVTYKDSIFTKIVEIYNGSMQSEEIIGTLNDSTKLSILYDNYSYILQKKYYYIDSLGLTYKSIDSIANEKIISEYEYDYDTNGFMINQDFNAIVYSDNAFKDKSYTVSGTVQNQIVGENISQSMIQRTYKSSQETIVDKEVYSYFYNSELNIDGIQNLSQKYLGKSSKNLIDSVRYYLYEDEDLIESGTAKYSYYIDKTTNKVVSIIKLTIPDDTQKAQTKQINNFSYIKK